MKIRNRFALPLCFALLALSPFAYAQTVADKPASAAPPELETLEEGEPPAVTIRRPGDEQSSGNSITERRDRGQTKEIKVQSGPSTYYLKPKSQVGSAQPGDAQSGPPTSAQWRIKEFDWGGKKNPKEGNAAGNAKQ